MSATSTISRETARRFLLGRQGLWPSRRWQGVSGVDSAIRALEALQLDPVQIVARSHDLVLWSRVIDYTPANLDQLLFEDRAFFDYGGHLDVYPIEELPYWRLHMRRRAADSEIAAFLTEHASVLERVRGELRERGPLTNRDIVSTAKLDGYRGSTDTARALYYLWLTGETMTHSRQGFERVHGFLSDLAPAHLQHEIEEPAVRDFFARKILRQSGLANQTMFTRGMYYAMYAPPGRKQSRLWLDELVDEGAAVEIRIEDSREPWFLPTAELPILSTLAAGGIPGEWLHPGEPTTREEVNLLSPLDNLHHNRERTKAIFDFEYLWEIYKPAPQRRWGAYTLPILYDDRLVARAEPKLDRAAGALIFAQIWFESPDLAKDEQFIAALARGALRLAGFLNAPRIDIGAVLPARFRSALKKQIGKPAAAGSRTTPAAKTQTTPRARTAAAKEPAGAPLAATLSPGAAPAEPLSESAT